MDDPSRAAVDAEVKSDREFIRQFEAIDSSKLSRDDALDREAMISFLRSQLLELEEDRGWQKDPDVYSGGSNAAVYILMERDFAPLERRFKSVIAREKQIPSYISVGRQNLVNPPRIFTEIAIEQIPDIIRYFQEDLPLAFKAVKDAQLQSEFKAANVAVIASLEGYGKFLKDDLLPRSNGDFRIGAELFRKKLLYDDMVDIPIDRLLKIGYENLRANQEAFKATARSIDSSKTAEQILDELTHEHPTADKLLSTIKSKLEGLKQFIVEHRIITIPSPVLPRVEETPPFERATSSASMDTPGPYEKAKQAYYFVTLPEPGWDAKHIDEHMQSFNYGTIISTSIHEAYPGHYVQFLWNALLKSKVRKLIGCSSNMEGWAHYTEQMMLDEGYGGGDPKLRLGQLQDALLRNARFIVGIEMHTGRMTYDQAIDFFIKEGYQPRPSAEMEAKRGTGDPTYLVYTLGKLAIMKLRSDYKSIKGPGYTLNGFHDEFMRYGAIPIKLIRRAMLGNDSPIL